MKLLSERIKGKQFHILGEGSTYQFGNNLEEINATLLGAEVSEFNKKSPGDILIGSESTFSHHLNSNKNGTFVFERELLDEPTQDRSYFKGFEAKFFDMLRQLHQQANVSLTYLSMGDGMTEEELARIETKLGRKLPRAVREFYQIFGELKLLWEFKKPRIRKDTYINSNSYCIHSGQHQGSMHIMPLTQVLFEDWRGNDHYMPEGVDLKIFDYYSLYHMLSFELAELDDPILFLGEDHGAGFEKMEVTFSSYLKMIVGVFGYINRFKHLQFWTVNEKEGIQEPENWNKAVEGFVSLDFSNQHEIDQYIKRTWERIHEALENEAYDKAYDLASDEFWSYDVKANAVVLDVLTHRGSEDEYFEWLGYAMEDKFDLAEYEANTKFPGFITHEKYIAIKEKASTNA